MSEKQKLINAFKSLNFEALYRLLDDNRSYMDVSKELFLNRLKVKLKPYINEGLESYEKVIEGVCSSCNKGCKAYKFTAEDFPSLNLFFEENKGKVTDIYLCNALTVNGSIENDWDIYFSFYEEEKVNFVPSLKYTISLQKVENAIEDFNSLASSGIVSVQELIHWHNKHKSLADELNLNDPFVSKDYKAYKHISALHYKASAFVEIPEKIHYSQEALKEYHNINPTNEREVVYWLVTHKNSGLYDIFKKTNNWKETGFIKMDTEPSFILDCSECLDTLLFIDLYNNLETDLIKKYEPTEIHMKKNGGSVPYGLESFLRLHKKYLDIL